MNKLKKTIPSTIPGILSISAFAGLLVYIFTSTEEIDVIDLQLLLLGLLIVILPINWILHKLLPKHQVNWCTIAENAIVFSSASDSIFGSKISVSEIEETLISHDSDKFKSIHFFLKDGTVKTIKSEHENIDRLKGFLTGALQDMQIKDYKSDIN